MNAHRRNYVPPRAVGFGWAAAGALGFAVVCVSVMLAMCGCLQ